MHRRRPAQHHRRHAAGRKTRRPASPRLAPGGLVVRGRTSDFGYLTGDSEGSTADGGTTDRPCIAIRDDSTLDHWFRVGVYVDGRWHRARLLHCDWGPGISTRAIDITGRGVEALGLSPSDYPTEAPGIAQELR